MSTRDSDELRRARSLRTEADALVMIDEAKRCLRAIEELLASHPENERLKAEARILTACIETHLAAAREAMRERGDNISEDGK